MGQLQALTEIFEVVAASGISLEQQDHGGFEFTLRFEDAELQVGSSCNGVKKFVWHTNQSKNFRQNRMGVLAWNCGSFKLVPDAPEVVAVPRFSLEQDADHGGFEFSLRFEAAGLHVGSGCKGLEVVWYANQQSQSLANFQFELVSDSSIPSLGSFKLSKTHLRSLQHLDFHGNHLITGDLSSLSGLELLSCTLVLAARA